MADTDIIAITDYSATEPYADPERFCILPGDMNLVLETDPEEDSPLGIAHMIFDRYMHWRFVHAVVLTMPDYEIFRKFYVKTIETCMQTIMDYYTLDHEVFMLNLIPYQMYKYDSEREMDADNCANMFKRWDFIDIGCVIRKRYIVTMEKKSDFLEVKEEPDPDSITLKYIPNAQLVNVRGYAMHGYYELMDGGYVPGAYITPYNLNIKKYVEVRCNGIGHAGITGNFREIW